MFNIFTTIVGLIFDPINVFVLLLLVASLTSFSECERTARKGRYITVFLVLLLVSCAILPVGEWAISPLENKQLVKLPEKVDGIILLTGDESAALSELRGFPIAGHATQRYLYAARLAKKYPDAELVVVGTTVPFDPSEKLTTRQISEEILRDIKVAPERIKYEEKSRTTHENALFATKLFKPTKEETWLLLTSAFHLNRAFLCFKHQNWKTIPVATDYFTKPQVKFRFTFNLPHQLRLLKTAAHEYVGLAGYWAVGWIDLPW